MLDVPRTAGLGWICLVALLPGLLCAAETTPVRDPFSQSVAPLLLSRCVGCHSGDEPQGGLNLLQQKRLRKGGDSGTAIVPGKPADSLIWQRVAADEMPPKHPLSSAEKQVLRTWIEQGAAWTGGDLDPLLVSTDQRAGFDWWSLQPLRRQPVPDLKAARLKQPIDAFVQQTLNEHALQPAAPASRAVLLRRLSFDLLGLPPSPEDVAEFLADERPDAVERLVDRLLASPHYGERWARHWLDVVRFGESNGFERDLPRPHAWPYRDWVIEALNADMPYDEFVRWQLAGDVIAPDSLDALRSVGFLVAGAHDTVVPVVDRMRAMMRQDELEDTVGVVGQTFLGLTLHCARCHDHKFDPITAKEYYQITAALAGIDHGEREFTPPDVAAQLARWQSRIEELTRSLSQQDRELQERLMREQPEGDAPTRPVAVRVPPIAAWDFTRDGQDLLGRLPVKLVGNARLEREGLVVDGHSFAVSEPLKQTLSEKTLQVRVRLKTLHQSGGGAISLQTRDGNLFDAIVYAELEAGRWMPGSNSFQRTLSFEGPVEQKADQQFVTLTQVYRADGTIVAYRDGIPYGHAVRKDSAVTFRSGESHVVFGLRHGTEAGGNRMLQGTIAGGRLYDRALTEEEVSAAADEAAGILTAADLARLLTPEALRERMAKSSERETLRSQHAQLAKTVPIRVYSAIATQPPPMKVHRRGSVTQLGDVVAPAGLAAIRGLEPDLGLKPDARESERRLKLAHWITSDRNPLFARVMANRIWHYHFGAGLVDTPSDFGFNGGRPTHPDLLEFLAAEFLGMPSSPQRYSIKHLHRQIITSATYGQGSTHNSVAARVDAGNRWLWRRNPVRLEAECVRDAMLSVAGQLNPELGGKGYSDVNSYFFKGTQFYDPIDPTGYASHRRTVYRMWARGGRSPFLDTFDCPDPSTTTPRRSTTVTPLQALSLMNHSFTLRMADHFARRLQQDAGPSTVAQVQRAHQLLYSRPATEDDVRLASAFIERQGLAAYCRALWNSAEFLFVD